MKKTYLLAIIFVVLFGFSGCGEDEQSNVAVNFVKALTELNIESAKELSSKDNSLYSLEIICSMDKKSSSDEKKESYIDSECLSTYTPYAKVEDIDVVETINKDDDNSMVELELVYSNNETRTVKLELKKENEKWKVTNPAF